MCAKHHIGQLHGKRQMLDLFPLWKFDKQTLITMVSAKIISKNPKNPSEIQPKNCSINIIGRFIVRI